MNIIVGKGLITPKSVQGKEGNEPKEQSQNTFRESAGKAELRLGGRNKMTLRCRKKTQISHKSQRKVKNVKS